MWFQKTIIDVRVKDIERAQKFYGEVLELPFLRSGKDWVAFEAGSPAEASAQAGGLEIHLYLQNGVTSGLEFQVSDIFEAVLKLKQKGIVFEGKPDWPHYIKNVSDEVMEFPWGKMAVFQDSENNELVLVEEKV
jgi:predicted enzyme related to lactoylglutathione lyase